MGGADTSTVPPKQSLIWAEQALVLHPLLTGQVLQILPSQWASAELAPVYPHSSNRRPKLDVVFWYGLKSTEEGRDNPFPSPRDYGLAVAAHKAVGLFCHNSHTAHCALVPPKLFL